jgi:SAM-dependent methyltransferase
MGIIGGYIMSIQYISGFYDIENTEGYTFRWMQNDASILCDKNILYIDIEYFMQGKKGELLIKSKSCSKFFLLANGWQILRIYLNDFNSCNLDIHCDYCVIAPNDTRHLSLLVKNIITASSLYDTKFIDVAKEINNYALLNNSTASEIRYWRSHIKRYSTTLTYLKENKFVPGICLETGPQGFFVNLMQKVFPYGEFYTYQGELRGRSAFSDNTFDSILCMEVFEHLADTHGHHGMALDGVFAALFDMHRILKNDGILFLYTPNATSYISIHKAISHQHPFGHPLHVREYTPSEIRGILSILFDIITIDTYNVFCNENDIEYLKGIIDDKDRGDDIFILCKKKHLSSPLHVAQAKMLISVYPNIVTEQNIYENLSSLNYDHLLYE